jgi:hypothetical protein
MKIILWPPSCIRKGMKRLTSLLIFAAAPLCMVAQAQYYPQPQPQQLDALVGPIALYPDPLLAQVLSAATFYNDIPAADGWSRQHVGLSPDDQARAIYNDGLPWDPSVIALLPFPSVLDTMAGDMNWTSQLGSAVLADRGAVMDAVQRQRAIAMNYGYLQNNNQYRVVNGGYSDIQIIPVDPAIVYVPYYDPYVVYSSPRPGFFIGGAITFGPRVAVRPFAPWGWGASAFRWNEHRIVTYSRPYSAPRPQFNPSFNKRGEDFRAPQVRPQQSFRQPEVRPQPPVQPLQSFRQPEVRPQPQVRPQQSFRQPEVRPQPPVQPLQSFRQPEVRPQPPVQPLQSFRQPEVRPQPQVRPQQSFRPSESHGRGNEDRKR